MVARWCLLCRRDGMRLDVTHAFSGGGLCREQGEWCVVSTVKKWTLLTCNSGA